MNESDIILMPCLQCGKDVKVWRKGLMAEGVLNVFCPNGECEDRYAFNH